MSTWIGVVRVSGARSWMCTDPACFYSVSIICVFFKVATSEPPSLVSQTPKNCKVFNKPGTCNVYDRSESHKSNSWPVKYLKKPNIYPDIYLQGEYLFYHKTKL